MAIGDKPAADWRDDTSLTFIVEYRRKFALFPVVCSDGSKVSMKHYYKKYKLWSVGGVSRIYSDNEYCHTDFVENVTEEDYMVRKLAETL